MTLYRPTFIAALLFSSHVVSAQELRPASETWNESHVNSFANIQYFSSNPVSVSGNAVKKYGVARVNYYQEQGDFCKPDIPQKDHHLGFYLGGLQSVGKFDLEGSFLYDNALRSDMKWNTTLGLNEFNPFILADSISCNKTVETFAMNVKGMCHLSDMWKTGLQIAYTVSRMSDQTDPRPETSMSRLPITLGAEYALSQHVSLGLDAKTTFYRSDIDYTIINPLNYYQYFLMKGVGDYFRRSSAEVSGYDREYKGITYGGAVQMTYTDEDNLKDFLEIGYETGNENATDQGSMPFKGGDYDFGRITLSNRFCLKRNRDVHNVILSMLYANGTGKWYDQKRMVDQEHGNLQYYKILSKYKVYSNSNMCASIAYDYTHLNAQRQQDYYLSLTVKINNAEYKHFDVNTQVQKGLLSHLRLKAGKVFQWNKVGLDAQVSAGYRLPLSTSYADAATLINADIASSYTAPMFQYNFAQAFDIEGHVDVHMPVVKSVTCGITCTVGYMRCMDACDIASSLKSSDRNWLDTSIYMKF